MFTYKHDCIFVAYIVSLSGLGVFVHYIYQRSLGSVVGLFHSFLYLLCMCVGHVRQCLL